MSLNFIPILTWYENPLGTLYLISPAEQIAFPSLSSSHFHSNAAKKKFLMTYGRKLITCPPGITEGEVESFHKHIFKRQDQKQYIATSERPKLKSLHLCPESLAFWDCSALR